MSNDDHDDLHDLRATLRAVDGELDHARVLRTVDSRRRSTRWVPLAAAAAVACVLLASVGALAWWTAPERRAPAGPVSSGPPLPDAGVLAARVRRAVTEDVACTRILQDGRLVAEQLRATRHGRVTVVVVSQGEDATGGPWPGCGTAVDPTPAPTSAATARPLIAVKVLLGRDLFAPLRDSRYDATVASATTLTLVRTTGPDLVRLRYDYELDPRTLRPVGVRVTGPDDSAAIATVAWFGPGTEQERFLRANAVG